jgi:hypothetical protein
LCPTLRLARLAASCECHLGRVRDSRLHNAFENGTQRATEATWAFGALPPDDRGPELAGEFEITAEGKFMICRSGAVLRLAPAITADMKPLTKIEPHVACAVDRGCDRAFVATADGTLRVYQMPSFDLLRAVQIGQPAVNIQLDATSGFLYAVVAKQAPDPNSDEASLGDLAVYDVQNLLAKLVDPELATKDESPATDADKTDSDLAVTAARERSDSCAAAIENRRWTCSIKSSTIIQRQKPRSAHNICSKRFDRGNGSAGEPAILSSSSFSRLVSLAFLAPRPPVEVTRELLNCRAGVGLSTCGWRTSAHLVIRIWSRNHSALDVPRLPGRTGPSLSSSFDPYHKWLGISPAELLSAVRDQSV